MHPVSETDYAEATDQYLGWCTSCCAFTRETTEPDAEGYDCPNCGLNTVMGAEDALLRGEIEIADSE